MPWCPKCKAEYLEGFTVCYDCGVELVDKLNDIDSSGKNIGDSAKEQVGLPCDEHVEEVLLVTTDDLAKFSYVTSMLQSEDIIYWVMEQNVGQYTQIVYGLNIFGKSVYVAEYDLDRAKEILSSYVPMEVPKEVYDIPLQDNEEDELARFDSKYKLAATIVGIMFYILIMIKFFY